jgi:hypothetical protein
MSTNRFHRCQCHAKCPNLQGWYLEVQPDDNETVFRLHRGVAHLYFAKFGMNPHLKPDSDEGILYNPIKLAAQWLVGIERFLTRGQAVLVNSNGGMMPLDGTIILETREIDTKDGYKWPDDFADDEIVTISRWPEAKHYYLSSSKDRIFAPEKYTVYEAARRVALRRVPAARIKTKGC